MALHIELDRDNDKLRLNKFVSKYLTECRRFAKSSTSAGRTIYTRNRCMIEPDETGIYSIYHDGLMVYSGRITTTIFFEMLAANLGIEL